MATGERSACDIKDILGAFVISSRIVKNCALSQLSLCTHNTDESVYSYFSISVQFWPLNVFGHLDWPSNLAESWYPLVECFGRTRTRDSRARKKRFSNHEHVVKLLWHVLKWSGGWLNFIDFLWTANTTFSKLSNSLSKIRDLQNSLILGPVQNSEDVTLISKRKLWS